MALADPAKPSVSVWYHDVPVPRAAEVEQHSSSLADLACRTGYVDCTPLVDMCMRFACLAYRRNTPSARSALCLPHDHGIELQFRLCVLKDT